jgi:hypothetical protein
LIPVFGRQTPQGAAQEPWAIATADFNNDGKADIVITNYETTGSTAGNTVTVVPGNGDGTFQTALNYTYTVGTNPSGVVVADFNGDGKLDLAVANHGSGNVSVLLGNGDFTFQNAVNYSVLSPNAIVVGDLNGDGKLDLIVSNSNGFVVLPGNGDGTFGNKLVYSTTYGGVEYIAVGDFNGDGKLDLVTTWTTTDLAGHVSIFLGNGDFTFQPEVDYAVDSGDIFWAVVGDFNGDGHQDLAVTNSDGDDVSVLLGDGTGAFQAAGTYPLTHIYPQMAVVGDFNKDGHPDLAIVGREGDLSVLLGHGDGTFGAAAAYHEGRFLSWVAMADFNGDGNTDLAVADYEGESAIVVLGRGDGTFLSLPLYRVITGAPPNAVAVGDFHGDGHLDLAVVTNSANSVSVLSNNGDGTFAPAVNYTVTDPESVAVGDFNGDGKADLAVAAGQIDGLDVLVNNGDGTFAPAVAYNHGYTGISVAVGDFNKDGNLDLVEATGSVSVLLGNGDGTFQAAKHYTANYASLVAVGYFCGKGNLDLVVASTYSGTVSVLQGNGNGTFQPPGVAYTVGTQPYSIAVGDFNGDGNLDVAVANEGSGNVSVLLGNGDCTFQNAVNYAAGGYPQSVAVGDFNGDGKLDLAVANYEFPTSVLLGNGDGTFQAPLLYDAFGCSFSVAVGDFNGDGRPDLVSALCMSNVAILMNATLPTTSTVLTSSLNPSNVNQSVTLTAAVAASKGIPTGTVTFQDGTSTLGTVALSNGTATFTTSSLAAGTHSITAAYSADSNFAGSTSSVLTQTVNQSTPSVTFTGAPASAAYQSTFTVTATTNASTTAVITASGACSIAGNAVTMISGTGACNLTANWAADTNHSAASLTQSTTAAQIAPTVTFTGAPPTAAYQSTFAVTTTTSASTMPTITGTGVCSVGAVSGTPTNAVATLTMTSGTGTCNLTANWAADANYTAASLSQSTAAMQIAPTVTFTGAPTSAAYQSSFPVTAKTNASTTAAITASGACSIAGNTVTMTSGTGICNLTANWAADANYTAASLSQSTAATQIAPTATFTGAPPTAAYQSIFTVTATTSASTMPTITGTGVCSVGAVSGTPTNAAATLTMISGTGTCNLTANWAADTNYSAASLTQSTAAAQIAPTVTFTGAPTSAAYQSSFSVTAKTNASTTAAITASGACSIAGNTVTMISGTGTCSLMASWAADTNYATASLSQYTVATKAPLTVTANNATRIYGQANPAFTGTIIGIQNGDNITATYSTTATPTSTVGSYAITPTLVDPGGKLTNYAVTVNNGTLTLTQATPVIAWTPASIQLGYPLGAAQLDATANVPGTFTYTPPSGTAILITSQTLSVLFTPTDTTDYTTASLSVQLTVTPGPLASVSPSSINFGTLYLGAIVTRNVTVTNVGNAPMAITDPFFSILQGGNSNEYGAVNLCPKSLAAGKSCTITVGFVAGPFYTPQTATLSVRDNAPGSPQTVALSATVINPQATLSASSLSFGKQKVNTSSAAKAVTLKNTGATPLTITSIVIAGTDPLDFTQTNNCPGSLAVNASCTMNVTFTPTAIGSRSGSVVITDNTQNSPQDVSLLGTGN